MRSQSMMKILYLLLMFLLFQTLTVDIEDDVGIVAMVVIASVCLLISNLTFFLLPMQYS